MGKGLDRYKVIVSAGLPTSVKMVALRISMATGWQFSQIRLRSGTGTIWSM